MRFSVFLFSCVLIMTACQKKRFQECAEFNKIIGEWNCIEYNLGDRILIEENGRITFKYSLERDVRLKLIGCGLSDYYASDYNYFKLEVKEGNYGFFINSTFDTLIKFGGAYNFNTYKFENSYNMRRYVKK
jgi:hypothetical protein